MPEPDHPADLERELLRLLEGPSETVDRQVDELCTRHPEHADRLRAWIRLAAQTRVGDPERVRSTTSSVRIQRMRARVPNADRYQIEREVGGGAMGVVYSVRDADIGRKLAMKVIRTDGPLRLDASQALERFVDEAQIMGQLDHPGVVPVHELGFDEHGKAYFTMRLVRGRSADEVLRLARRGAEGWTLTRALEVVLKVCDTMAFAHAKGVLHRDLKPSNVMVGRYGEVYVMDWGLAKVLGEADRRDLRLRRPGPAASQVRIDRAPPADSNSDSPLITMDGDIVGTPSFMPPEQAEGLVDRLGPASDVYAVGAMLYELLSGWQPYVRPGSKVSANTVLAAVLAGPPKPLHEIDPDVPAELVAICDKAMARHLSQRYPDMEALAEDLRAFLEKRVVKAYRVGAFAEMRMWVRRNRALAASLAAVFLLAIGGAVTATVLLREARAQQRLLDERQARFDRLAIPVHLVNARERAEALYPPWPEQIDAMRRWLTEDADRVRASIPQVRATLAELDGRRPKTSMASGDAAGQKAVSDSDRFLRAELTRVLPELEAFEAHERPDVEQRLGWAECVESLTVTRFADRWKEARVALAKADGIVASMRYRAVPIDLRPQVGLIPIGKNPATGLWEFYDLRSAWDPVERPDPAQLDIVRHGAEGAITVNGDTGVVLVLIPGGRFWMGAQREDPGRPNFDPWAKPDEVLHEEMVEPFFLARYELTQGQWRRLARGATPSQHVVGERYDGVPVVVDWSFPVEQVSWDDCVLVLRRHGMVIPTEVEWEYACRADTPTPWYSGPEPVSLLGHGNVLDLRGEAMNKGWGRQEGDFDDGFGEIAPVGVYRPNPWGLHDMHGNVFEWCFDLYPGSTRRVYRSGSFISAAQYARSALRDSVEPSVRFSNFGVRAARPLMP